MVIMEKGHYGQYTGNARHSRTPVTRGNYKASERDDAAHIDYLKRDIKYDAKHGGSDKQMTNDEKHISKLAGDMKYDKKHHSPLNNTGTPVLDEFGNPVPADFVSDASSSYDENAASRRFFTNQNIVNNALGTLKDIESGNTPYTGYANASKTVKNALLGSGPNSLTIEELEQLNKGDANTAASIVSKNIRTAPLGDARNKFNESYNPFRK
jgi:hypothetical protein